MNRYIRFVLKHPIAMLAGCLIITVILSAGITRLRFDTSISTFLPKTDPAYKHYEQVKGVYGDVDTFVILSVSHQHLWQHETFEKINQLLIDLEAYQDYDRNLEAKRMERLTSVLRYAPMPGDALLSKFKSDPAFQRLLRRKLSVLGWDGDKVGTRMAGQLKRAIAGAVDLKSREMIDEIISAFTIRDISGENDMLEEVRLIETDAAGNRILPETAAAFNAFIANLKRNPVFEKGIYATDENGHITDLGFIIRFPDIADSDPIAREILEIVNSHEDLDIIAQGEPIVYIWMNNYMQRDLSRLVPLVMLVAVIIFFINFRSFRGVVLPFLTLSMSTIWILGLMGYLGINITTVGVSIPVLMIAVGSSYGIHILNQYYSDFDLISSKGKREGLQHAMSHISITVLLTGLTTFVAFMTLATHQLTAIRDWGIFCAMGILFAVLISATIIPAGLELMPHRAGGKLKKRYKTGKMSLIDGVIRIMARISITHYGKVLTVVLLLIIASVYGLSKLQVETELLQYFKKDDPIRTTAQVIGDKFGGRWGFMILIDSGEINGVKSPEFLQTIEEFRNWLEAESNSDLCIGRTDAFSDFIKTMHMAMHNDDPAYFRVPENKWDVMDYLEIFSGTDANSDGRVDRFEPYVDPFFQTCNVIARLNQKNGHLIGSAGLKHIFSRISAHLDQTLPEGYDYEITGHPKMLIKSIDYIVGGQLQSLFLTFGVIAVVVLLLLRNFRAALLSLIPMSVAVMINFGIMGWFGIQLDIATSIIAAITIGIGVDDTIHFLNTFRCYRQWGEDVDTAIRKTLEVAGKAIIFTSLALICGFSVLELSPFKPLMLFGLLMAVTMVATTLGALVVLPAAIKLTGVKLAGRAICPVPSQGPGAGAGVPQPSRSYAGVWLSLIALIRHQFKEGSNEK